MMKKTFFFALAALAIGCGDDDAMDAGPTLDTIGGQDTRPNEDAGPDDGGPTDAADAADAGPDLDGALPDVTPDMDTGIVDAGPIDMCPDLMPAQGADGLILSQYDFMTGQVEFFNPTGAPIGIDGLVLCSRPAYEVIEDTGIMVPPGGYATHTALPGFQGANPNRGELALYDSTSYTSRNAMIDFFCWGEELAAGRSRKSVALMAEGDEVLWEGACTTTPTMNVVTRGIGTAGTVAGDYVSNLSFAIHTCE